MSTRSRIGVLNEDGSIRSIYCHSDGYPSYLGKMLVSHYKSITKIQKLLELGDISVLGEEIGEKHPFDYNRPDVYGAGKVAAWGTMCLVYFRDRGEPWDNVGTADHACLADYLTTADDTDAAYVYLYKSGEWHVTAGPEIGRGETDPTTMYVWRKVVDVLHITRTLH